jgi:hypothetical protein
VESIELVEFYLEPVMFSFESAHERIRKGNTETFMVFGIFEGQGGGSVGESK